MPGDPGRSAFSPLPECALPRRRAALGLYIGRALAGLRVPPVRELPTARAGGRPRRRAALSLLLCPPLRGLVLLGPQANFPSLPAPRPLFVLVRAALHRGLLPTSPLAIPTITGPRKMSTTLLSAFYDIDFLCKVSRQRERMVDGLELFGVPRLGRRGGRDPSKLTLRVEGSPEVSSTVLATVGVESWEGASSGWSSRAPPERTAATLPGLPGQCLRRPPRGHGPRITWLDPERPGWASSTLLRPAFCECSPGG